MFWKFDLNATSHVDKLLEKEGVTLHELMDQDDILQECKAQNQKLLDFLCRQQCMEELVHLISQDPPLDMEEKVRFKYPNTACELLTSDVPQINDKLGGDETLLNLLYDFLNHEPPLNPLLASFISKTIGNLIARKTEQVIGFLKKKDQFISLVLRHLSTSATMDLLLRLASCVEPASLRQEVLHWLNEEMIIQRLVELVHPGQDEDRQSNASQTLCDIVRLGRDQSGQLQGPSEPDPLLAVLESQGCVEQLLKNMFDGDWTESCLVSGTQVLLTLLETGRAGTEGLADAFSQGLERAHPVNSSVLHGIVPRLKDFHQLLLSPPKKQAILTTIGVLEEPLGNARLHSARLVAALLHTSTPSINQELCRLSTLDLLLDLFFKYAWNNFLHLQVELCIAAVLSPAAQEERAEAGEAASGGAKTPQPAAGRPEGTMVTHLFQKCCLVQRILEAWEANDRTQAAGGRRRGNMGHLTRIANAVVQSLERGPAQACAAEAIQGLPEDCRRRWDSFVEDTLPEANRRNAVDLVSTHLHSSSEDEDIDGAFPQELSLQQAFSEYQVQRMTASFVDQFGFNDEEFADQDDSVNMPFDRVAEINFHTDAEDDGPHASLFEACCGDHIQPFDDPEDDDDLWEDRGPDGLARAVARARFGAPQAPKSCSKISPERGQDGTGHAEATRAAPGGGASPGRECSSPCPPATTQKEGARRTAVLGELTSPVPPAPTAAVDVGSGACPASAPSASAPEEQGWAVLTDFPPCCCSEAGPRCSSPVDTHHVDAEGSGSQCPEAFSPAAPCAWSTRVPRKAPLVASDSSSSGGSDSKDDAQERAGVVPEATPMPTPGASTEGTLVYRSARAAPAPAEGTALPAVVAPTAAPLGTATPDRPTGAAVNGSV
ncbi:serine/threonine-protein phosphatase 6 regulatory subunit 2 isoform X7 [Dasypus novemcinctus]|uniref:serine/threonine-protein phosphatase 6 regulatory subunit 2 isoform X7 n=1 Tax=Dasypus novemcinctus TaxID=9361 RepID=UPI00265F6FE5|nr:serine/threonine-protein phosphatase 6 regulatory subunit 2 isoform X8 [Dasypus novemcinctus]